MLGYLVSPNKQFVTKDGAPMTAGHLEVYLYETDDRATTYSDFNGTLNPADIAIDANGRASVIADDGTTYRIEVYDASGALQWTVSPAFAGGDGAVAEIIADLSGCVRADVEQDFSDAQKSLARENIGAVSLDDIPDDQVNADWNEDDPDKKSFIENKPDLSKFVRADIEQNFTDAQKAQARDNITAQKQVGGPGAFINTSTADQNETWARVANLDLSTILVNDAFNNIALSFEVSVYNTGNSDREVVEHGRFNINVHAEPNNNKWLVDAGWAYYKGQAGTRLVELVRISRNIDNNGRITRLTVFAKVAAPATFYSNALSVAILNNHGSIHKNDSMNSTKNLVAPWKFQGEFCYSNFYGLTEKPGPLNTYPPSLYDSYIDYPTFNGAIIERVPQGNDAGTMAQTATTRGNIPMLTSSLGTFGLPLSSDSMRSRFMVVYEGDNTHAMLSVPNAPNAEITLEGYSRPFHGKCNKYTLIDNDYVLIGTFIDKVEGSDIIHSLSLWGFKASSDHLFLYAQWHAGDQATPAPTKAFQIRIEIHALASQVYRIFPYDNISLTLDQTLQLVNDNIQISPTNTQKVVLDFISDDRVFSFEILPKLSCAKFNELTENGPF